MRNLLVPLTLILLAVSPGTGAGTGETPGTQEILALLQTHVAKGSLRAGDRGEAVVQLQRLLSGLGHEPGPADGVFGPLTQSAVIRYQNVTGVKVDGIFGVQSLRASLHPTSIDPSRRLVLTSLPEIRPIPPAQTFGLTFNGAIDPKLLRSVIDTLNRHGFRATFFIPGEDANRNSNHVLSLVEAGHEVAPLGFAQVDMVRLTPHLVRSQTRMARNAIAQVTGEDPVFFRPPFGRFTKAVSDLIEQEGLKMVMWTNVTVRESAPDWPEQLANSIYPGAVVMLRHDLVDTVNLLDQALAEITDAGYRGVSLNDLYNNLITNSRIGAHFDDRFPHF